MPSIQGLTEVTGNLLGNQQHGSFYLVGHSNRVNVVDKLCSETGMY